MQINNSKLIESIFLEIKHYQIECFIFEEYKGMVMRFVDGDIHTELTFGDLELSLDTTICLISNKDQLEACSQKDFFIQRKIQDIEINNGDLIFNFENDNYLCFKHSDSFENWELRWMSKIMIYSLPGGGVDFIRPSAQSLY